jgi:tight adherence protein B
MLLALAVAMIVMALGGAVFVFAGSGAPSEARLKQVAAGEPAKAAARNPADVAAGRRRNIQNVLKEIEAKQAASKPKMSLRRRLDMAGFEGAPIRNFWIASGALTLVVWLFCLIESQSLPVQLMAAFAAGLGLPRWVLGFLKRRRERKFTADFANAIDVIVRSVKSGLPSIDALKIVGSEFRDPVGGEFLRLTESLRIGLTLEEALKRMYESMPTPEVGFFGIVMTIQSKSGGNLSEALSNLSTVLRDRKRLKGKIKAMSSEAKASAMIIGSLPPAVMGMVYATTPAYISLLFTERLGNLMLAGCALWMGAGIFVMKKMIDFKH